MGLPTLDIVSHCWRYERCLAFHLSALALHPPAACQVVATVFYCPSDLPVVATLDYFRQAATPPAVAWNFRELPAERLCRRAIGRNIACLETAGDFVLLSDVDYLFGPGALDAAALAMQAATADGPRLMFPRGLLSSIDHAAGDAELARVDRPQVVAVDPARYSPDSLNRGIGGAQWLPGQWARERGYLADSRRFQRPAGEWRRTYCDRAFRRWSGLESVAINVPNIYRLRHSKRGRFDVGCRN